MSLSVGKPPLATVDRFGALSESRVENRECNTGSVV
jgi:hypothetical protein